MSQQEREVIFAGLAEGKSMAAMAKALARIAYDILRTFEGELKETVLNLIV